MACGLLISLPAAAQADIYRWDNGQLIPGTEGITPGPGVNLNDWHSTQRNLRFADFSGGLDLTAAYFSSWLDNSRFNGANLTRANLPGASLTNADLSGANLTDARLWGSTLTNANLSGAIVTGADFYGTPSLTSQQLYSTASYQQRNLRGIGLDYNNLSGWDFSGQDLTGADFGASALTNANLSGTNLSDAYFFYATLTNALLGQWLQGRTSAATRPREEEEAESLFRSFTPTLQKTGLDLACSG
jgi:hypothetical protein